MSNSFFRRNNCRLCGGTKLELVLQLTPTPIADAYISQEHLDGEEQIYPLELFLCHNCGHLQLLDVVDREALYGNYSYLYSSSFGLAEEFDKYAEEILQRLDGGKGSLVIDIGSNDGTLLRSFQRRGMRVLGIDPTHAIAQKATKSGIETIIGFFTAKLAHEIRKKHGAATIVTMSHMFANFDDFGDIIDGIRDLLAADGILVAESLYPINLIQNMIFDFIYHEHLSYYSVRPLEAFFRRHDMELIDVKSVNSKGGSLRYIAQLSGGPHETSTSVAESMAFEADSGIDRAETFAAFAARIDAVKTQLTNLLHNLKAQGKSIAGYGASATTTTLLYHFGLGKMMDYIVDDNPVKQNTFSPGYHIPVFPSELLYKRKPDYVLILAWRYAGPIMKKHRTFSEQGRHFIVPLPELEVI